ncbi:signal peptide containing protein [Theileria equi strain WA]|uniref:Signal peptide containing protein n=1 Tax=Theileria equi strain WA TaxID=1537102 RepID=L1LF74_THEEQ|nr:signal peptide containing protein [Theileria equi strain WA]EKX74006.1 signal peptide containing protein [Theileria equi strain WA]|eukprot:XP_004833458.1 signal peptide containing protein [Theileria equi strain WA]
MNVRCHFLLLYFICGGLSARVFRKTGECESFVALRPFLRKPKVRNRISREERKRRSRFSNQLAKELRMKYWERIGKKVNNVVSFPEDQYHDHDIDPKRGFIVQEVIPRMVTVYRSLEPLKLSEGSSSAFDRHAFIRFLCDIKAVFALFMESFGAFPKFELLSQMGPSEQINRLQSDINYMTSLMKVEESMPSKLCAEYLDYLRNLIETNDKAYLCNVFIFYKEWHLCKDVLLNSIRTHLKIVRRLKCRFFDPDCMNLERVINLMSVSWDRSDKDSFLNEIDNAYIRMSRAFLTFFSL